MKRCIYSVAAVLLALVFMLPCAVFAEGEAKEAMPSWYPEDVDSWTFTPAAENAPRVVDDADVFTDEEEARLEAHIRELAPKFETDIVIFTDMSTHGLTVPVYAADFYDFSGYGYGDQHDGFCLFILMDPADRQGWCCVTGDRPRGLYTEDVANDIDDALYEYLGNGEYFEGVYDWITNIGTLLDKGIPFAPDWYPSDPASFRRFHDAEFPRVNDIAGVLTESEIAKLTEKAKAISEQCGLDIALLFTNTSSNMYRDDYCEAYYRYNGLGFGDSYDGILTTFFTGSGTVLVTTEGKGAEALTEEQLNSLISTVSFLSDSGSFNSAGTRWLNYLGRTLKTGRVPKTPGRWVFRGVVSAVVALIASSILTSSLKKKMETVKIARGASDYLVHDSLSIQNIEDEYINSDVTRVYKPLPKGGGGSSRGGGSGGGRSSYSSSYRGSSGSSHSGSGRRF